MLRDKVDTHCGWTVRNHTNDECEFESVNPLFVETRSMNENTLSVFGQRMRR
jgi:hypothetical protein